MAWIESHQALEKHPKVLHLGRLLGVPLDQSLGILHRFWWWTLTYAENGNLEKYGIKGVSEAIGIDANKLVESGWIDVRPCTRVHDWWDYIGRFLQTKYKNYPRKWKSVQKTYLGRTKAGFKPKLPNLTKPNLNTKDKDLPPIVPQKGDEPIGFGDFWKAYPRHVAKPVALKAWSRLSPLEELRRRILEAIEKFKQTEDWQKDGGKFIPHPATWLNQRRWEDEINVKPGKQSDAARYAERVFAEFHREVRVENGKPRVEGLSDVLAAMDEA